MVGVVLIAIPAEASRIKDLCEIQGAQVNAIRGVGLVIGLNGTGDQAGDAVRRQERLLKKEDIDITSPKDLESQNVAVVMVDAIYPPFAKQGTRLDVRVSTLYDAESLQGGVLLPTYLEGEDGEIYAVAQGGVSVGGFLFRTNGTGVAVNHVTVGLVENGGIIEREIPSNIIDGDRMTFLLKRPDFRTAGNISDAIDDAFGTGTSRALNPGSVLVRIPEKHQEDYVTFVADVQDIDVEYDMPASIIINERTGTLVIGGDIIIKPCQVAHGELSIRVSRTPYVSQPGPLSGGRTVAGAQTSMAVTQQEAYLAPVDGTSAQDVADALNDLRVTPRDMIAIFQAIQRAGAMDATIEPM
jgi:flagellar P-ring protein precursor FlgI